MKHLSKVRAYGLHYASRSFTQVRAHTSAIALWHQISINFY
jgi:hypothetical protein